MTNKLGDLPLLLPRHRRAEGAYSSSRHYERRPRYHTSSCEAAFRFAPLEVSCEGLQWLVVVKENSQYRDKQDLARKATWPIIYQGDVPKITTIEPRNPGWALAVEQQARRLKEKIEFQRPRDRAPCATVEGVEAVALAPAQRRGGDDFEADAMNAVHLRRSDMRIFP